MNDTTAGKEERDMAPEEVRNNLEEPTDMKWTKDYLQDSILSYASEAPMAAYGRVVGHTLRFPDAVQYHHHVLRGPRSVYRLLHEGRIINIVLLPQNRFAAINGCCWLTNAPIDHAPQEDLHTPAVARRCN